MTEIVATDFRGNEIRVGDTVLYPRMSGRSCEMTEARVERIDVDPKGRQVDNPDFAAWFAAEKGRQPGVPSYEIMRQDDAPARTLPVPAWKFSLMPLRSTRFRRYSWSGPQKPVFIQLGENVVRVMDA